MVWRWRECIERTGRRLRSENSSLHSIKVRLRGRGRNCLCVYVCVHVRMCVCTRMHARVHGYPLTAFSLYHHHLLHLHLLHLQLLYLHFLPLFLYLNFLHFLLSSSDARGVQINPESYSVHDVTGALKDFFKCLPDPLLTHQLYPSFISAMGEQHYISPNLFPSASFSIIPSLLFLLLLLLLLIFLSLFPMKETFVITFSMNHIYIHTRNSSYKSLRRTIISSVYTPGGSCPLKLTNTGLRIHAGAS